jgi:hypothetical protein
MSSTIITQTTVFTPGAAGAGTLNFSGWTAPAFDSRRLVAVINKTRNPDVMMYQVLGGTGIEGTFSGTTLTLDFDTTGFSASDSLEIHYEDGSTATLQSAQNTLIGAVNETAPASDTANSGLNGRLQRIAQRLTSLITGVGAITDASATTDTGNFSIISFIKRALQNWTLLLTHKLIVGQSGQSTATANNILNNPVSTAWTDCSGFSNGTLTITGLPSASGQIIVEGSQDAVSAIEVAVFRWDTKEGERLGTIAASDFNAGGLTTYDIPISFSNIRVRIISNLTNAIQARITLNRKPLTPNYGGDYYNIGSPAQTAITSNILTNIGSTSLDCSGFKSGLTQITSTGTGGTFQFLGSNTDVLADFQPIPVFNQLTGQRIEGAITATSSKIGYRYDIGYRYIRLAILTTITGGSIQAFTTLKTTTLDSYPLITGQSAHSSPVVGNPVRVGAKAVFTTFDISVAEGDTSDLQSSSSGQLITIPYSSSESFWSSNGATGGIINNTAVQIKAAVPALRNYVKTMQLSTNTLSAATDIVILDGVAVIWRGRLQTVAAANATIIFDPPLRGSINTALNVQNVSGVTGGIYVNFQGYTSL